MGGEEGGLNVHHDTAGTIALSCVVIGQTWEKMRVDEKRRDRIRKEEIRGEKDEV